MPTYTGPNYITLCQEVRPTVQSHRTRRGRKRVPPRLARSAQKSNDRHYPGILTKTKKTKKRRQRNRTSPEKRRKSRRKSGSRVAVARFGKEKAGRKQRFVGLKNQGATCYVNCIVQSLFHLPRFRELVDTADADPRRHPVTHALNASSVSSSTPDWQCPRGRSPRRSIGASSQQDAHEYLCIVLARGDRAQGHPRRGNSCQNV